MKLHITKEQIGNKNKNHFTIVCVFLKFCDNFPNSYVRIADGSCFDSNKKNLKTTMKM